MTDTPTGSRFTQEIQKFAFAIFAFITNGIICALLKYDGVVFQNVASIIVIGFLCAQAVVEWKKAS